LNKEFRWQFWDFRWVATCYSIPWRLDTWCYVVFNTS